MTADELYAATHRHGVRGDAMVETKQGNRYWVSWDQVDYAREGDMVYGFPVKRHLRDRRTYRWFKIKNLKLVND